jgi:hypothetical protein
MSDDLPLIDVHEIVIRAPRSVVFAAVERHAATYLRVGRRNPLGAVLGAQARSGFAREAGAIDERVVLGGRHRFARYRLTFELDGDLMGPTRLVAKSYGVFPGVHGRMYRAAVIGSRGHVVVMKRILRSIERAALHP